MATTQADEVQTTVGNIISSSSSRRDAVYFQSAVVFIGVVGTAANALILYAMIASKQHKKQLLIFHQNVFDLCSCVLLVITYAVKLFDIPLVGRSGYWLCMILVNDNLLWCSTNGSVINLMSVTIERYLKVVHPAVAKKLLRKWVIYSAMVFAWISSVVYIMALMLSTSAVIDGFCYAMAIWKSRVAEVVHAVWNVLSFYVLVVFIFVICYWRILVVIRRQASIMAGHSGPGSSTTAETQWIRPRGSSTTAQTQSHKIQSNVVKTMILVSAFYVITWMPIGVFLLVLWVFSLVAFDANLLDGLTFLMFFYICANPFIYATKFNPVKRILLGLIPCKNQSQQA